MNDKPTDYFGNEIEVGDIVAYATSSSSNIAMNHGRVKAFRPYEDRWVSGVDVTRFKLTIEKLGRACFGAAMQQTQSDRSVTVTETKRCINLSKYK